MMTSSEIRQSFLDFFKSKQHAVVSSSSLLPDAPNLLFTNAGMNQFVPIFLGQAKPRWDPPRTADTQKCIRAGGKHNDLEDVGLDTYHHTFFEMLGNWSFGDPEADDSIGAGYFKREAIDWAWELLVNVWGFPKERLYATYFGGDGASRTGKATPEDTEAREHWLRHLPVDHVVAGGRKDNFWMMGDTGPCGPCSEIHMDLTPRGDGGPRLVNAGTAQCIEIWNLVFIQFNANPDGSLTPLSAKHVDTGLGFERVCGIIQCTDGLKDFTRRISNYESDVFTPIFRELETLSGKKYGSTLPGDVGHASSLSNSIQKMDKQDAYPTGMDKQDAYPTGMDKQDAYPTGMDKQDARPTSGQIQTDIAFRVIADHIRCLSFAVADGILPSNEGRGYVLRRILRRAVRYGRNLGFHEPFFYKLVGVVADHFGDVFPEVRNRQEKIEATLKAEEESFNRTLDRGIEIFEEVVGATRSVASVFPASDAFKLYDTYGFPLDLTELMARERGLTVDVAGFEKLMEEQRRLAREDHAKKKTTVTVVGEGLQVEPTKFLGYDNLEAEAVVEAVSPARGATGGREDASRLQPGAFDVVFDQTPFYAEMGGQVGDTGLVHVPGHEWTEVGRLNVVDTQKQGDVHVHRVNQVDGRAPEVGEAVRLAVDAGRRGNIQRHHTVTHLFHWALHEVVSRDARQRGSLVAPDRLRFDFNHGERLTDQQIADIERLVNERIQENARVFWFEMPYAEVRGKPDVMQFFGDKYGDVVRIVQIGGHDKKLDGFSMELCGGTHTRTTGEIGLFKITRESAIASGIRRVEAVCGQFALEFLENSMAGEAAEAAKARAREEERELARQRKAQRQQRAPEIAERLLSPLQQRDDASVSDASTRASRIIADLGEVDAELLRSVIDALKPKLTSGIVVLGGVEDGSAAVSAATGTTTGGTPTPLRTGKVHLICYVTPDLVKQGKHAGRIVGELAKICGGGGGGRPDLAQAGGKQPEKLAEALAAAPRIAGM
jgi:alanyl-tRNA synthetase